MKSRQDFVKVITLVTIYSVCIQLFVSIYVSQEGDYNAAFIDFEKAFDRVNRQALYHKLNT